MFTDRFLRRSDRSAASNTAKLCKPILLAALAAVFLVISGTQVCKAQDGTFPLPTTPPPTGLQAPLPAAAKSVRYPANADASSPTLASILGDKATKPIDIQQAVAIALYTNRTLALAEEALLSAQGHTAETKSALNPTVGSSYTATQLNQGTSVNLGGQNITIVNATQQQFGVQATLPLDISGLLHAATSQAKFMEISTRLDINRARNQIVLEVKSAFYDSLRARALLEVAQEALKNSLARQSDAQKRLDAGVVAPYDLQRAATDVASSQLQLISAKNQVSQSLYALKNAIGIDLSSPLSITDAGATQTPPGVIEPDKGPITPPRSASDQPVILDETVRARVKPIIVTDPMPPLPDYRALLTDALATRPEILEAEASISAAKMNITLARRSRYPTLGLVVGGTYTPNVAGFGAQSTAGSAVLSLNVPLIDGGVEKARMTQARANVAQAITEKRIAVDTITFEMESAYQTLRIARDSLAVANESVALAKEAFRLARVRYTAGVTSQAGLSPLLEVTDAQTALTQAESNQVNALYNYNNARSKVDKAVGRYAFVFNSGKEPTFVGFPAPPSAKALGKKTGAP